MVATITLSDPDTVVSPVSIVCATNLQVAFDPASTSASLTPERTRNGNLTNPALATETPKYLWILTDAFVPQADIGNLLQLITVRQPALIKEPTPRYLNFSDDVALRLINQSTYNTQVRVSIDADLLNPEVSRGDLGDNVTQNVYRVNLTLLEV